jgi:hypothetical protein
MQAKEARPRDLDGEFSELIGPLDPVFSQFSRCETDVQFNLALEELFDLMDDDHSGIVSFLLCSYVCGLCRHLCLCLCIHFSVFVFQMFLCLCLCTVHYLSLRKYAFLCFIHLFLDTQLSAPDCGDMHTCVWAVCSLIFNRVLQLYES